jgi:hypothetical protein
MVSWKVVLAVIIIAALAIAIGMWFGYRYVAEQEDISPEGRREPSNTANSLVLTHNVIFIGLTQPSLAGEV